MIEELEAILTMETWLSKEELRYLKEIISEEKSGGVLRYFILSSYLMGQQMEGIHPQEMFNQLLREYRKTHGLLLNQLLIKIKTGEEVDLAGFRDKYMENLLFQLKAHLRETISGKETTRLSHGQHSLDNTARVRLLTEITGQDISFLNKIISQGSILGFLHHLFFVHTLMAQKALSAIAEHGEILSSLNPLLVEYSGIQKAILNKYLLAVKIKKPLNLKEIHPQQENNAKNIVACLRKLL